MPLLSAKRLIVPRGTQKLPLQSIPDRAILRLARALARQAAREDHERDQVSTGTVNQESGDLRPVLDGPAKREIDRGSNHALSGLRVARKYKHHRSV